jgi:hypothetical protein
MSNTRVNDRTRFYAVIEKFDYLYNELSHTELADVIQADPRYKSNDIQTISHRTLRRYIAECRNQPVEEVYSAVSRAAKVKLDTPIIAPVPKIKPYTGGNKDGLTKMYIIMGCMHMPWHNKQLFNAMLNLAKHLKSKGLLTGIILNGDILDMHSISRHGQNKITMPGWDLQREYNEANKEFDKIDEVFDGLEKVFFYGNHEMWYYDFMSNPNNFKLGQGVVASPEAALKLKERGYNVHNNYKTAHVKLGDSEIIHGDYVNLHASHAHASRMKRSVIFAHTHRAGSYMEQDIEAYNIGWGGDKNAPVFGYMTRVMKETWKNGLAVGNVDSDNLSHITPIIWKNNKFYFGGMEFKA